MQVLLPLLKVLALLLGIFIDKPVHLIAKSLLHRIRKAFKCYREFEVVDKEIEETVLELRDFTILPFIISKDLRLETKLAILLHGTDTVPKDFFSSQTYLNNLGTRLRRRNFHVFAPYIIRDTKLLQRVRLLRSRIEDEYLEEELAEAIVEKSMAHHYEQVVVYGISWGAEVALEVANKLKPNLLILSGLDVDPLNTQQHKYKRGKLLDPMYIPGRENLHDTLEILKITTILEYGDRDADITRTWSDNVLELQFKGGHEINPTDTTLDSMERLLAD